jgi:hypothetical protein
MTRESVGNFLILTPELWKEIDSYKLIHSTIQVPNPIRATDAKMVELIDLLEDSDSQDILDESIIATGIEIILYKFEWLYIYIYNNINVYFIKV